MPPNTAKTRGWDGDAGTAGLGGHQWGSKNHVKGDLGSLARGTRCCSFRPAPRELFLDSREGLVVFGEGDGGKVSLGPDV